MAVIFVKFNFVKLILSLSFLRDNTKSLKRTQYSWGCALQMSSTCMLQSLFHNERNGRIH